MKHSYGQILKSSVLIGGASVMTIGINIVRTKAMAVLLGPSGVGLLGLYGSIADLTANIAGLGINSSGVRQIAESVGTGDDERIARTAVVLRRTSVILGLLGIVLLGGLSVPISRFTFGSDEHDVGVALLSLAVFFRIVTDGSAALIQGMRRIGDLARMNVAGALLGAVVSIPIVYVFRDKGVVPALVAASAMGLTIAWWYARKIEFKRPSLPAGEVRRETRALLRLGVVLMASGIMTLGSAYAIRMLVVRSIDFHAAGLYQSAWALGGLYVGLILQSMGADFYPRLTAIANDDAETNRVVNEQARISLLMAAPGVLATLTFAPLVIAIFYTREFAGAVPVLRWLCLGMAMRIISWPMGYILLAKGNSRMFFAADSLWTLVHVGLAWICLKVFGLSGAGMAFFGAYVCHCAITYAFVRHLSGFRWSAENKLTAVLFLGAITIVFGACYLLPPTVALVLGASATAVSGVYSLRVLLRLVSLERIPRPVLRWLVRLRLAPPETLQASVA